MPDRIPDCAKCGDLGWVITVGSGVSGATRCDCQATGAPARRIFRAQIPELYQKSSFENFQAGARDAELKTLLVQMRMYAEEFPDPKCPGLLLIGSPGVGKTHLAVSILRRLLARDFDCLFYDYQTLLNNIRAGYDESSNTNDEDPYRAVLDAPVLLLDDLGAHRVTDWVQDTVTSIITHRCNTRKPLIATTNLPDADAGSVVTERGVIGLQYKRTLRDHIGDRARSRLFEMCTVVRIEHSADFRTFSASQRRVRGSV